MKMVYKVALIFAVLFMMVSIACGSSGSSNEGVAISTESIASDTQDNIQEDNAVQEYQNVEITDAVSTPASLSDSTQTPMLGDIVENYGYLLSATAVEDPATKTSSLYEPENGKKLVAVEFIVGNVSGETFSSNVLYATLVDNEGFSYRADTGSAGDQIDLINVNPGEKVKGWAGFIVPEDAIPSYFKYAIRDSSSEVLMVGLSQQENAQIQEPAPTNTPRTDIPMLGDTAENYGYLLSITAVEDPATKTSSLYEPENGRKLVAVEFIVGNVSGKTFSSNVLYATLVDTEGFLYRADTGSAGDQIELIDVNPGEKVKGWAGFIIPEDAIPSYFKYAIRDSSSEVLMVSLISSEEQGIEQSEEPQIDINVPTENNIDSQIKTRILGKWSGAFTNGNGDKIPATWEFLENDMSKIEIIGMGYSYNVTWTLEDNKLLFTTELDPDNQNYRIVEFLPNDMMKTTKIENNIEETWVRQLE